jgi:putative photosynthetic complex assembly protein 2
MGDHLAPALSVLALWIASTAAILWLVNRPRATHGRSLFAGGIAGVGGLAAILLTAGSATPLAAYVSFAGGLLVWGWHELAFLTGAVAGPRKLPADPAATGWRRLREATATVIHHEIALAATAALLLSLTWNAANPAGAHAFLLLFVLRLSAKFNLHVGVPSVNGDLLPPHLAYLGSYFRQRPLTPFLTLSLVASLLLAVWLGVAAITGVPGSGAATGDALLFALAALGALEHVFLALPIRDSALWRWAIPARASNVIEGGRYGL